MKRIITLTFIGIGIVTTAISQNLVSTAVAPRNAVLEEFTGVNCVNCPDGHYRAQQLYNAFPGRVVIINIHSGSFAVPGPGQPDFRTPFGEAIDDFAGVPAYPSGTMNRIVWPGAYNQPPYFPQNPPNNLAIRRPGWWDTGYPNQGTGAYIILQGGNSPVNIGAETIWNNVTRELTVNVELYYTATETVNNKLNVVFLESGVIGYQSGGSANYVHNHIMRHMLTGQWGDNIATTTQGTLVSRSYVYTVPTGYDIDNCDISIFVTRDDNYNTHTGITIDAKNGTTVGLQEDVLNVVPSIFPNPVRDVLNIYNLPKDQVEIRIVNMIGKVVKEFITDHESIASDVSELPSGVYFATFTDSGKQTVIRFVKD